MSLIMRLIVGLIVFLKSFEKQAAPLPLLTRTATVHTNLWGETQDQPREGRWGCELCTRRARRQVREAMPHCTGPGRGWTARRRRKHSGAGAGGHVGEGHEELALGELDDQLVLPVPAAKGNEGKR